MSFLNSLIKSFVRSAVNQVGRDVGRVVSNRTLKARHAIIHSHVPQSVSMPETIPDLTWTKTPELLILSKEEKAILIDANRRIIISNEQNPSIIPPTRILTRNQLLAYALQLAANADGNVHSGEASLAMRLHTVSDRDTLDAATIAIRNDIDKGIHPLQTFKSSIAKYPEDVRLNALRLMAKIMLQDGRFVNDEQVWFFESVSAADVEVDQI